MEGRAVHNKRFNDKGRAWMMMTTAKGSSGRRAVKQMNKM